MVSEERSPWARPESASSAPAEHSWAPAPAPTARPAWPQQPRRRNRTPLVAVAVVLVLALATGLGAALWWGPAQAKKDQLNRSAAGLTAQRYLQAIASADAQAAAELAVQHPTGPLLTDEVLASSRRLAPITDIEIAAVQGNVVELAYQMGGKPVRGKFPMVEIADGQWLLQRASTSVRIAPEPQLVPTTVNGVRMGGASYVYSVEVFPGTYTMTTGSRWLDFAHPQFTVTGLDAPVVADSTTKVSDAYPPALRAAIDKRLKSCTAKQELAPTGCPWAFREDATDPINRSTIHYTLDGDPWRGTTVPVPGKVTALADGSLAPFTVKFSGRGKSGAGYDTTTTVETKYQVDLLSPDLEFVWQ